MLYLEARIQGRSSRWPLAAGRHVIGRSPECDIVINDRSISSRHAAIEVVGRKVAVEDLGSTNGMWIDGRRVPRIDVATDVWFVAGLVLLAVREGVTLTGSSSGSDSSQERRGAVPRGLTAAGVHALRDSDLPAGEVVWLRELARCVAAQADRGTLAEPLLEHFARRGAARGAVVARGNGAGTALIAAWGDPPTPEVRAVIDASPRSAAVVGTAEGAVLALPLGPRGDGWTMFAWPWNGAAFEGVPAELICALLAQALTCEPQPDAAGGRAGAPFAESANAAPVFVTVSPACRAMLEEVDRIAATTLPALLVGESGTGKELLARRLHARSGRGGAFVALNCAALPKELLESELFGIERGVATGVTARSGRFQLASGGTLFLDEIGDLPDTLQPKLLRVLESGEVTPLGAPAAVKVDVRVVAATHADLRERAERGSFRRDLLYRLAGAVVRIAPLRDRPEDILPLTRLFAREAAREQGNAFSGVDLDAARLLLGYAWPGNVRELRHAITRAVALADGPLLHAELLPPEIGEQSDARLGDLLLGLKSDWREARDRFARFYFTQLLERTGGNMSEASRLAGLARTALYRKLEEIGLRKQSEDDQ